VSDEYIVSRLPTITPICTAMRDEASWRAAVSIGPLPIAFDPRNLAVVALLGELAAVSAVDTACAQQAIGSATTAQNQVTRELVEPRLP
jgi:hypothetical protein